jgi:hypothetical protein
VRVEDSFGDREQQLLEGCGVDAPVRGLHDPVPRLSGRGVDQRDGRRGRLQRLGRGGQALEVGDLLIAGGWR